jgi:GT2 family glycosyltransferase
MYDLIGQRLITKDFLRLLIKVSKLIFSIRIGRFNKPGSSNAHSLSKIEKSDYEGWIKRHDTLSAKKISLIRAHITRLTQPPVISLIMAVDETPEIFLLQVIASFRAQLYPHWELCFCINSKQNDYVKRTIEKAGREDSRIFLLEYTSKSNTSSVNDALKITTGEYVAFIEPDCMLPIHALYSVATEFMAYHKTDMLFTDEDLIDKNCRRQAPWFKPGWNPELLLHQNFISHLTVYRRVLLEKLGGLREEFSGAAEYDLALRFSAYVGNDRVRHLPGILYHSRLKESQTYCSDQTPRAIAEYLCGRNDFHGIYAVIDSSTEADNCIRVRWPLPEPLPKVSIIVPTRDRSDLLSVCADGILRRTDYSNFELIIADNGSVEQETAALFSQLIIDPRVKIVSCPGIFNYSAINNAASKEASGDILVLLNNDIDIIGDGWLHEIVSIVIRPEVGAVGARLLYADDTIQHCGVVLGVGTFNNGPGVAGHFGLGQDRKEPGYFCQNALPRDLCAVTAACLAVRREVFQKNGGLNEINLPIAFNDVDFCLRIRATGLRVIWTPYAEMYHLESASRGSEVTPDKVDRFRREAQFMRDKWGPILDRDPFYNPVFSRAGPLFAITRPSRLMPQFEDQAYSEIVRTKASTRHSV